MVAEAEEIHLASGESGLTAIIYKAGSPHDCDKVCHYTFTSHIALLKKGCWQDANNITLEISILSIVARTYLVVCHKV